MRYLWILLILSGCSPADISRALGMMPRPQSGTPPIVTANESATAIMTIVACPTTPAGGALVAEMIQSLSQQSPIVTAQEAGTARLTINTCPSPLTPDAIRASAEAARAQPRIR